MCQREQKEQSTEDRPKLTIGKDPATHGLTTLLRTLRGGAQRNIASLVVARSGDLAETCLAAGAFRPMRKFTRTKAAGRRIWSAQPARPLQAMLPSVVENQIVRPLSDSMKAEFKPSWKMHA